MYRRNDITGFNQFVDNSNLLDLDIVDGPFTWFGLAGRKSILDRTLVNSHWWSEGSWILRTTNRKRSDHKALLLSQKEKNWGPVPFKVFNSCLRDEGLNLMLDRQLGNLSEDTESNNHMILKNV